MDITKITDIKELKALAYDQIVILEQTQINLKTINERMAQIQQPVEKTDSTVARVQKVK